MMVTENTTAPDTAPLSLVQLGYCDYAEVLDGFGTMGRLATPGDVQKAHVIWQSVPEHARHLTALCFSHFDSNRSIFDLPPEDALPRPPMTGLDDLPRSDEEQPPE